MPLSLVSSSDPILRRKAKPITEISDPKIQELIDNMTETMLASQGVGLAAPQVGKTVRLIIVNTKDGPQAYLNPVIFGFSFVKEEMEEGCLSLPGVFGNVLRPKDIDVGITERDGTKKRFTATGLFARIIQHEIDHLNGILFIDRAKTETVKTNHENAKTL